MSSALANVAATASRSLQAAPAAGDTSSLEALSGEDFAALLLGQMLGGQGAGNEPMLAGGEREAAEPASATPVDPAQLLAELGLAPGLPTPAALPGAGNDTSRPASGISMSADTALAALATKDAANTPGETVRGIGERAQAAASTPPADSNTLPEAATTPATAAKVAGFAQQLAEKLPASGAEGVPAAEGPASQAISAPHLPSGTPHAQHDALSVATPVRDAAWSSDFGQKVVWLATQDKQAAQITLNPPQLGPIEISLSVKNDQATAVFASPHAEVREAIETALPRLREMLAGVGIELGQANVNAESFRQAQDNSREPARASRNEEESGSRIAATRSIAAGGVTTRIQRGNGLVDTFA